MRFEDGVACNSPGYIPVNLTPAMDGPIIFIGQANLSAGLSGTTSRSPIIGTLASLYAQGSVVPPTGPTTTGYLAVFAGTDQFLTDAVSTSVSGTYIDTLGSGSNVPAVTWTQIGGPSAASIANPNSLTTLITALTEGIYTFQLAGVDGTQSATSTVVVSIRWSFTAPVVTSSTQGVNVGQPFTYATSATESPTSYAATLPGWLTINTTTGVISGTAPGSPESDSIPISATNAHGTGTGTLVVNVIQPTPSITVGFPNFLNSPEGSPSFESTTSIAIDGGAFQVVTNQFETFTAFSSIAVKVVIATHALSIGNGRRSDVETLSLNNCSTTGLLASSYASAHGTLIAPPTTGPNVITIYNTATAGGAGAGIVSQDFTAQANFSRTTAATAGSGLGAVLGSIFTEDQGNGGSIQAVTLTQVLNLILS
jgi:hypothetical protein